IRKTHKKRTAIIPGLDGIFYILSLISTREATQLSRARQLCKQAAKQAEPENIPIYQSLHATLAFLAGEPEEKVLYQWENAYITQEYIIAEDRLSSFFHLLTLFWINRTRAKERILEIMDLYRQSKKNGWLWIAMECATMISKLEPELEDFSTQAEALREKLDLISITDFIRYEEPWERTLKALTLLGNGQSASRATTESDYRLAWMIEIKSDQCSIQPKEQKKNAKGHWTKGRNIALKRLYHNPEKITYLTSQDLDILRTLESYQESSYYGRYSQTVYEFDWERAMLAMVNHPLVFWKDQPTVQVEVVKGHPEVIVKRVSGQLKIAFNHNIREQGVIAIKETPTRCLLLEVTQKHHEIASLLGKKGLSVPETAQEQVLETVGGLSSMVTVQSAIGLPATQAKEIPSNSTMHLQLTPFGEGLQVKIMVRPLGEHGAYLKPGRGAKSIITEIEGTSCQTTRNLSLEKRNLKEVIDQCSTLSDTDHHSGSYYLPDPEQCLELLLELKTLEDKIQIEWPEGESFHITHQADMDQLHLRIKMENDWFGLSGELKLDDQLTLEMQQLINLLSQSESRFIPLGEGRFLSLTEAFRNRLEEIKAYSVPSEEGYRFHHLAAHLIDDITDDVGGLKASKAWHDKVDRMHKAQNLVAEVPTTFQAQLRDYQQRGFQWLSRLSAWGVGACLADDMGLGKTLQALALLLTHAPKGPALIVAP
ncbi:SNF2-related protein, partial [Magnetococcales bacterium HHB-1]